ncbi:glycosyltransferase [Companilactobacillus huachuanensis]|uniref:Glycosyltransferase n=1 Tax=Companilactobacillus huachuanensis TaxID=2559914 RepID=A0ABW1RN07_9LACO|nr:glycosyltransferase [Companilactobacillus huachuanensis]
MKKICLFIPYMTGFGGTETVITNLFTEYNRSQSDATLSLVNIGGFENGTWLEEVKDKKIIWLSKNKWLRKIQYALFLPLILYRQIKSKEVDIVISTNPVMWFLLFWIKKITHQNYQVMSWYHYSLSSKNVAQPLLKSADGYLAISTGIAKQIVASGISEDKVKTVFNPILKKSTSIPRTQANEKCRFIYVGRVMLDGQKNLRATFEALSKVHGDWQLDVIGNGYSLEMQTFLTELGIKSNVKFSGFKEDVWSNLRAVDGLVLSSKYEGFPMVLNESISVGIPVLAFDCPTGPADIVNSQNGILVPTDNQAAFVAELQKFIDRRYDFTKLNKIKNSIEKFYSENYFLTFMKSLDN